MPSLGSLRQIRRRIRSVENTQKITRAMEMVATAKLRRFQDFLESARPYTERMEGLLDRFQKELPPEYDHPFLEKKISGPSRGKTALVLFTSDTGLCGTYNYDLETFTREWVNQNPDKEIHFLFAGKHGAHAFQGKETRVLATFSDFRVSRLDEILEGLRKNLERAFLDSAVDEVLMIYTRMETLSRYHVTRDQILPIPRPVPADQTPVGYLIEPDRKTVADKLIPAFFDTRLRFIFYQALLSEQWARMTAMRQATQNAEDMLEELTLLRNKARQATITKEIIEVVSGSRALKLK